mgnify:FL=1
MRDDILHAFDLVAHSVLHFDFLGQRVRKGWVEGLVLGDTRCGKSETAQRLVQHYRAGEVATGENATYAGLIGGMQQTQKTWSITWGKIPLNDRRMLVIDEVSSLDHAAIARMSSVRSSGVAEVVKIQTERTASRVRLLWIGNPRRPRPLASYNSGVEAVQELIGQPEDVARFDFAVAVAQGEVPLDVINRVGHAAVPHVYTSDLCRRLVYWAWSRRPDDVVFAREAEEACLDLATKMSRRYSSAVPLVEPNEQRIKLARLAAACAARLFSTDDGHRLLVLAPHVEYVVEWLDECYSKPSMGYDLYSRAKIAEYEVDDPAAVEEELGRYTPELVRCLADAGTFTASDLEDFIGSDRERARALASFLVRHRCAKKSSKGYYKLPAFIALLRGLRERGLGGKQ